jgi:hypothetical protein
VHGRSRRRNSEYGRCGTARLAVLFRPRRRRHIIPSQRRTERDFTGWLQALVDVHYPQAERIRLAVDNLNTHTRLYSPNSCHEKCHKRQATCEDS